LKKLFTLLFVSMLVFVLAACGSDSSSASDESKKEATASNQEAKGEKKEADSKETNDSNLTEVGQVYKADDGHKVELLKIKDVNETVDIAPLKVTVQDIKVLKMSDLTEAQKEEVSYYAPTGTDLSSGFSYIQVKYTTENTEDKNIEWYDLMNVVTDKGEQIDGQMNDIIMTDSDSDSEFIGKVNKEFVDGFIVKDGDINSVKLVFGNTMDADSYEDITGEQTVEYSF
jgi:rare lipoprotein A (peptidoglycan hydrolase)